VVGDRGVFTRVDKLKLGAFARSLRSSARRLVAKDAGGRWTSPMRPASRWPGLTALQGRAGAGPHGGRPGCSSPAAPEASATLAIQLAAWMGAKVATTASPRGEELVRDLSAAGDGHRLPGAESSPKLLHDYDGATRPNRRAGSDRQLRHPQNREPKTVSVASLPDPTTDGRTWTPARC